MAYAERGGSIWSAGAPIEFIAVVAVGFVKMTKLTAHGQEITLELLGPGQCFGLLAAIDQHEYPLSAIAVSNCWYLRIPRRVILPLYQSNSDLKDSLLRRLAPRLRKAHDMMSRMSSGRVEERLAAVLFVLAESYGERDVEGLCLQVPLTRQDLSEMAGTTVETTIRVMSRWQKQGILRTDSRVIRILDEEQLARALTSTG
jgi:CRP/FNR family transcriptional regulator